MNSNTRTETHEVMEQQKKEVQMERVFKAFKSKPKTMLMVESETGIMRSNITRYVAEWRKRNKIAEVKRATCPVSKHEAAFLSTDPKHIHPDPQTSVFPKKHRWPD